MKEILKVKNISKKYQAINGEIEAIKDVSFTIEEGEFVSLIGPSGCREIYYLINDSRFRRKKLRYNSNKWRTSVICFKKIVF